MYRLGPIHKHPTPTAKFSKVFFQSKSGGTSHCNLENQAQVAQPQYRRCPGLRSWDAGALHGRYCRDSSYFAEQSFESQSKAAPTSTSLQLQEWLRDKASTCSGTSCVDVEKMCGLLPLEILVQWPFVSQHDSSSDSDDEFVNEILLTLFECVSF